MDRPQAQIEAGLRLEENWMAASEIGARERRNSKACPNTPTR